MAYRFDVFDGRALLWQEDFLFNSQPVFSLEPESFLGFENITIGAVKQAASQETVVEKRTVYEGPLFATPSLFSLNELDGTNGFTMNGLFDGGLSGWSVAGIGDVNNDGVDDFAVGATDDGANTLGHVYVVFGSTGGFPGNFDLSTLNGTNGFTIEGLNPDDQLGFSISRLGDMNDDGIDDFVIGANRSDTGGAVTGSAYVIFGANSFTASFDLSSLDGTNGFAFNGTDVVGQAGYMVTDLGDINNDGIADVMIGAPFAGPNDEGEAYVIFGSFSTFLGTYDRSFLTGFEGFVITGLNGDDNLGFAADGVGDFNGDNIDDFLISAPRQDAGAAVAAGQTYLVFGNQSGFGANFDLSTVSGTVGITFHGVNFADLTGDAVSGAGDINNDGLQDIIIGAHSIGTDLGGAYVVFGTTSTFAAPFDLSTLDGTNGFFIQGLENRSTTGFSVSDAGDFNGDGIDDLVIAAPEAGTNFPNEDNGAIFLIFGTAAGFSATLDLTTLDGTNGTRIDGINFDDQAGFSVSNAGDINGDGMSDLIIGAPQADTGTFTSNGQSYIVYGYDPTLLPSPPVAEDDQFFTDEATGLGGNILADNGNGADSDVDGDTLSVIEINGDAALVGQTFAGDSGGIFVVTSDGTLTFNPNGDFEYLNPQTTETTGFSYTVSDGNGGTDTAFVSVEVTGLNDGPTAVSDDLLTNADTNLILSILDDTGAGISDSDPDSDISVSAVNGVSTNVGTIIAGSNGGTFLIYAHGGMVFQPGNDFDSLTGTQSATTSVTYTIDDGFGATDTATVTVTVLASGANIDPVAYFDDVLTDADTTQVGSVFWDNGNGQDRDDDGDTLTVTQVEFSGALVGTPITGDSGGQFIINADGTYSFNPNGAFTGLSGDQFIDTSVSYTISDGNGGTSEAFITVRVLASGQLPDLPIARNDFLSTDSNNNIAGSVHSDNGAGPDEDFSAVVFVNGVSPNVGQPVAGDTGGTFVINGDGTFTFDPGSDFDGLAPGEIALTSVTYQLGGGDGTSEEAVVVVAVTGAGAAVNNPPNAFDDEFTTDEDNAVGGNVFLFNGNGEDSDPDGDTITVTEVNGVVSNVGANVAGSTGGIFIIQSNGVFTFQPNGDYDYLAVGESATSTATYTIDDGNGGTDTATVTVTITGVNDNPNVSVPLTLTLNESDTGISVFLLDGANDVDTSDSLDTANFTLISGNDVGVGPGSVNELIVDGTAYDYLAVGETEIIEYSYDVIDGNGGSVAQTLTITINGENDVPTANDDAFTTDEANTVTGNIVNVPGPGGDTDPDINDVLFVSAVAGAAANVGTAIAGSTGGLFTILADGSLSFDPNGDFDNLGTGQSLVSTISYTISDGNGGFDTATVSVTINGIGVPSNPPVANDDDLTTDEDSSISGSVFADNGNGIDNDVDGDIFTVTEVDGQTANVGVPFAMAGGGTITINPDGSYTFNPGTDFQGLGVGEQDTTSVTYTIDDSNSGTDTATVLITVTGVNDGPVGVDVGGGDPADPTDYIPQQDGQDGEPLEVLDLTPFFRDPDTSDILTISVDPADLPGWLSFDPLTNTLSGTPDANASQVTAGTYVVPVTASDGNGGTLTTNVTYVITNPPPVALSDTISGDPENNLFDLFADNGNGADFDPDGDTLVITHINGQAIQPGGEYVFQSGLTLTYTGAGNIELSTLRPDLYEETFTYTVSDGQGGISTETVTARFMVNFFDLSNTNVVGLTINGVATNDESGFAVAGAGDINNDGFDDFMIGAHFAGPNASGDPGATYVIFGGPNLPVAQGQDFDLTNINGTNGFVLTGIDQYDNSGWSVASAGDVNGDDVDDIIISGHLADPHQGQSGEVYVVFGGQNFGAAFDLGSLNGTNGFIINGIDPIDQAGYSVSGAGDVNGDGINDILIGARGADPNGQNHAGESYVVFGTASGFAPVLELSDLNGNNGFAINGIDAEDFSGFAVAGAGDVNGDGVDDILIGAPGPAAGGVIGEAYVVFGQSGGFSASLDLSSLNGSNGFTIAGLNVGDGTGFSLAKGGDLNGDGFDDIIIGAPDGGAGTAYIIYGDSAGFAANFDLSGLDGTNGFMVTGMTGGDEAGFAVAGIGDFDGDGIDDFIVGAPGSGSGGNSFSGQSYLIYGRSTGQDCVLDVSTLDGQNGFALNGIGSNDESGYAVTGVGDVNGDGFDDILIGAPGTNAGAGQSYLLTGFARNDPLDQDIFTEKAVIYEIFTDDSSGNATVSELPPIDKPVVADDAGFVFVEKATVSDDIMGLSTDFGDFVLDQDVLAEFLAHVQTLRHEYANSEEYWEIRSDYEDGNPPLSYFADIFNFI